MSATSFNVAPLDPYAERITTGIAMLGGLLMLPALFLFLSQILLTGIAVTAKEMEAALLRNAGNRKLGRVLWQPDPDIQRIVDGWPKETRSEKAASLGMAVQPDVDSMIREFIEDELTAG
jgi:hypothetical protein